MEYRERDARPALAGLVKAFWTLDAGGEAGSWIEHEAVPDGCIELIRRVEGRSIWGDEQPELFAVGIGQSPAVFKISGDARFTAVRLWPWAWVKLSAVPLAAISDRWIEISEPALTETADLLADQAAAEAAVAAALGPPSPTQAMGEAIIAASSVREMQRSTGLSPRALQRWFERNVGMAPSRYLRVLRFHKAFVEARQTGSLAEQAAEHGFADQAHMAREFRALAGAPASAVRRKAAGPFLR
jgi:AraC-like DNA-binding protein